MLRKKKIFLAPTGVCPRNNDFSRYSATEILSMLRKKKIFLAPTGVCSRSNDFSRYSAIECD